MSISLGSTTFSSVTWTTGDVITEAKLDNMTANDQAYDSHASNGLLLNNSRSIGGKVLAGSNYNFFKMNTSDQMEVGDDGIVPLLKGTWGGWIDAGETWTYASADGATGTFTIAGDLSTKYFAGMRIKLTQTSAKYFLITSVVFSGSTTITVWGGTDYTLANAAITSPFYSTAKFPIAFPTDPNKWTVSTTSTSNTTQASPVSNTVYNLGGNTIVIPIGIWDVSYLASISMDSPTSQSVEAWTGLSTANNSLSDNVLKAFSTSDPDVSIKMRHFARKFLTLTVKTTYYMNYLAKSGDTNLNNLSTNSNECNLSILAVSAYY